MSSMITVTIPSRPRSVRPASYGGSYDPVYRDYDFENREGAERFLLACGYTFVSEEPVEGSANGSMAACSWEGVQFVYEGQRGRAVLECVEIS